MTPPHVCRVDRPTMSRVWPRGPSERPTSTYLEPSYESLSNGGLSQGMGCSILCPTCPNVATPRGFPAGAGEVMGT